MLWFLLYRKRDSTFKFTVVPSKLLIFLSWPLGKWRSLIVEFVPSVDNWIIITRRLSCRSSNDSLSCETNLFFRQLSDSGANWLLWFHLCRQRESPFKFIVILFRLQTFVPWAFGKWRSFFVEFVPSVDIGILISVRFSCCSSYDSLPREYSDSGGRWLLSAHLFLQRDFIPSWFSFLSTYESLSYLLSEGGEFIFDLAPLSATWFHSKLIFEIIVLHFDKNTKSIEVKLHCCSKVISRISDHCLILVFFGALSIGRNN